MSDGREVTALSPVPPAGIAIEPVDGGVVLATRHSPTLAVAIVGGAVALAMLASPMPMLSTVAMVMLGLFLVARPSSQEVRIVARCVSVVRFEAIARCEIVGRLNHEVRLRLHSGKPVRIFTGSKLCAEYVAHAIGRALAGAEGPIAALALPEARVVPTRD